MNKPIKTEADYKAALARADEIFDAKSGTSEGEELEPGYFAERESPYMPCSRIFEKVLPSSNFSIGSTASKNGR